MNAMKETIGDAWDSFFGRVIILSAIAGGPFFYFLSLAADAVRS